MPLRITTVGGPTAVLELGGLRLVVDPTFDPPGDYPGGSRVLTKTAGPALSADAVGRAGVVLLSHDEHPDNLDDTGRRYALSAPLVLSTPGAEQRMRGPVRGLVAWQEARMGDLTVTAVPARHGPPGSEPLVGEVTGFVLTGDGLPTTYVSGDNASLEAVERIAERFRPVDVAVLFAGGARTATADGALLTLSSEQAAEAARMLDARHVVPVHFEDWTHLSEGRETLRPAFERAGLAGRLALLERGGTWVAPRTGRPSTPPIRAPTPAGWLASGRAASSGCCRRCSRCSPWSAPCSPSAASCSGSSRRCSRPGASRSSRSSASSSPSAVQAPPPPHTGLNGAAGDQ